MSSRALSCSFRQATDSHPSPRAPQRWTSSSVHELLTRASVCWMKTDRAAFSRATLSRLKEQTKRWNGTLGKEDGEDSPPTDSMSAEGQALSKKFVLPDPNNSSAKILNDLEKKWKRGKEMDNYAFELIRAHQGSPQLEEEYKESGNNLEVGAESENGAVVHLGAGVFLEKDTPGIDRYSRTSGNSMTITRLDFRDVANKALDEVDAKEIVAVVVYPGAGKTRWGLTYALQTLLWRTACQRWTP